MLNAYLMKGGEQKKSKFYNLTEPYFKSLTAIMLKRWGDLWVKMVEFLSFSLVLD
jgi:HAE1 family hydrophobic/amphiphilic exporter-1/multidrug efflux pump